MTKRTSRRFALHSFIILNKLCRLYLQAIYKMSHSFPNSIKINACLKLLNYGTNATCFRKQDYYQLIKHKKTFLILTLFNRYHSYNQNICCMEHNSCIIMF